MSVDISGLNVTELEKLAVDARARIEVLKKSHYADLRRALEAQARTAGFDIYELFSGGRATRGPAAAPSADKRPVAVKYRNTVNAEQTWTGRGKHPHWVRDALLAGAKLSDFLV